MFAWRGTRGGGVVEGKWMVLLVVVHSVVDVILGLNVGLVSMDHVKL